MSKITRYNGNVVPFANNAQAGELFDFGSSVDQNTDLTSLVNADYLRGWGVVGASAFPPLEWFNAQAFTHGQFISYLHQMGVPEWSSTQEYPTEGAQVVHSLGAWTRGPDWVIGDEPGVADSTRWIKSVNALELDTKLSKAGVDSVTGTATFTALTNNINLTNISLNREIGDVIDLSGSLSAAASNDPYFTIEFITDVNNVIVNSAHANGTTSKSLIDETLVGATISLVSKWNVAPLGLGQGWVATSRFAAATNYPNLTNRTIKVHSYLTVTGGGSRTIHVDGFEADIYSNANTGNQTFSLKAEVPSGSEFSFPGGGLTSTKELR